MRSQIVNRLRSNSTPLNSVPPASTSNDYSTALADLAARIIYRSPLPSQNDLPVYVLNGAAFPDAKTTDYDTLLPYVLSRLPDDEELIGGLGYEVVFFAGAGDNAGTQTRKGRPSLPWLMQAYHTLTRAKRKRLQKLYIVYDKNFFRLLIDFFASVVSPKFRKKLVLVSTLSGLALHIPIEDLLIPPSAYLIDRRKAREIYAPYARYAHLGDFLAVLYQILSRKTDFWSKPLLLSLEPVRSIHTLCLYQAMLTWRCS